MKYKKLFLLIAWMFGMTFVLTNTSAIAAPATFTVTNTNDSGAGSLRQAILDANSNGNPSDMDVVEFNIPGSDVHTINIQSDLPLVTEKLTIDGYSQPGAQPNTSQTPQPINSVIKIEINGENATITQGGIGLVAEGSIIQGLAILNSAKASGNMDSASVGLIGNNTSIKGSYVGVQADGVTPGVIDKNSASILAAGNDTIIGGTDPADRNIVFSKSNVAQSAGIAVIGTGSQIYGNYIGIAKDGVTDLSPDTVDANGLSAPFYIGINLLNAGGGKVGGPDSNKRNLISGNMAGVIISSPNNLVQGNYIGTDYTGKPNSGITNGMGVTVVAGSDSLIGGTNDGEGNVIAGVRGSGVEIASLYIPAGDMTITPSRIAVLGNSIHSVSVFNLLGVGNTNLGIDLSEFIDNDGNFTPDQFEKRGPNPNDVNDTDGGPNNEINYPVLKTAQQIGDKLTITYDLDAAGSPSNTYRIEFFTNNERSIFGYGPGETYIGSATVSPGTDKTTTLTVNSNYSGKALSATTTAIDATSSTGFGATSEFSQNISIGSQSDFDADGIADSEEAGGPNNGDANADGTPDSQQPTVTTFVNSANIYITLVTEGCSENGRVSSIDLASLDRKDNGYHYPYGLTDFTLYCSKGETVDVEMFIHTQISPEGYLPRKFNPSTNTFSDVLGATLAQTTVGESTALKLSYSITDGGQYDDDDEANGVIVDPIGLATEQPASTPAGELAKTGLTTLVTTFLAGSIIAAVIYTYVDYRKHKKPLLQADAEIGASSAKHYTYWHHLKVVSVPLARYRLKVVVEERRQRKVPQVG